MTKADNFRFNSVSFPAIRRKPSIRLGVSGGGGSLEFSHPMTMILLVVLLLVQFCSGEILYHRRDHRDQQLTPPLTQRTRSSVQTYNDALKYLKKYGYLSCTIENSTEGIPRRDDVTTTGGTPAIRPTENQTRCSDEAVVEALRSLQEMLGLEPTGRLDDDTKLKMSKGRCGNSDKGFLRRVNTWSGNVNSIVDQPSGRIMQGGSRSFKGKNRILNHRRLDRQRKRNNSGNGLNNSKMAATGTGRIKREVDWSGMMNGSYTNEEQQGQQQGQEGQQQQGQEGQQQGQEEQQVGQGVPQQPKHWLNIEPEESLDTGNALIRRLTMLQRIEDKLRKQDKEKRKNENSSLEKIRKRVQRKRRSLKQASPSDGQTVVEPTSTTDKGGLRLGRGNNQPIRWRFLDDQLNRRIPHAEQKAIMELSFRMWSEVIPLKFVEDNHADINAMDILIAFGRDKHWNCEKPFDGNGGELAHSWTAGDIHFDADENFIKDVSTMIIPSGVDLLKVAVHEIGHVLGLLHNDLQHSIMYPIYISPSNNEDMELARDDREAVQQIYGVCKGSFDLVIDLVKRYAEPDSQSTGTEQRSNSVKTKYTFNTYFFRSNRYWMYENGFNRTRYGDPHNVELGWTGLPTDLDASVQVLLPVGDSSQEFNIDTYFFKGAFYYKYNMDDDRVEVGYPRRISNDFGCADQVNETIPDDLDAAYFNSKDKLLYFFKDEWVWLYDPREIGRNSCCVSKRKFTDLFPMENERDPDPLTGKIDSIFYSYPYHTTLILKQETVYEVSSYYSRPGSTNGAGFVRKMAPWYNIWFDICDVE